QSSTSSSITRICCIGFIESIVSLAPHFSEVSIEHLVTYQPFLTASAETVRNGLSNHPNLHSTSLKGGANEIFISNGTTNGLLLIIIHHPSPILVAVSVL
ncbi:MAG TPA: hypothetical protein VK475_01110, partial [Pyrinomonadaceae bacterium]|nr:hypothetical protein [Pyrinomonadaceae bacterium]